MAEGDPRICAVSIEIDEKSRRAVSIEPFIYPPFPNTAQKLAELMAAEEAAKKAAEERKQQAGGGESAAAQ